MNNNDDEAHNDGLLCALILKEVGFVQSLHESARICCRLLHVAKVVGKAVLVHTG